MTIENRCPHKGGPLCDGIVSGTAVVCPLHGWRFDLDTRRGDSSFVAGMRGDISDARGRWNRPGRRQRGPAHSRRRTGAGACRRVSSSTRQSRLNVEATSSALRMRTGIPSTESVSRCEPASYSRLEENLAQNEPSQKSDLYPSSGFFERAHAGLSHGVDRVLSMFFQLVWRRSLDACDPG